MVFSFLFFHPSCTLFSLCTALCYSHLLPAQRSRHSFLHHSLRLRSANPDHLWDLVSVMPHTDNPDKSDMKLSLFLIIIAIGQNGLNFSLSFPWISWDSLTSEEVGGAVEKSCAMCSLLVILVPLHFLSPYLVNIILLTLWPFNVKCSVNNMRCLLTGRLQTPSWFSPFLLSFYPGSFCHMLTCLVFTLSTELISTLLTAALSKATESTFQLSLPLLFFPRPRKINNLWSAQLILSA